MRNKRERTTDPAEFKKFHMLLLQNAPPGFTPPYIPIEEHGKYPPGSVDSREVHQEFYRTNRCLDFEEALERLEMGKNVGIIAVPEERLLSIDTDYYKGDIGEIADMPETLSVTSRSRAGRHFYLFISESTSYILNGSSGNVSAPGIDCIKVNGGYTLTPGSYVPVESSDEAKITREDVPVSELDDIGKYTIETNCSPAYELPPHLRQHLFAKRFEKALGQYDILCQMASKLPEGTLPKGMMQRGINRTGPMVYLMKKRSFWLYQGLSRALSVRRFG